MDEHDFSSFGYVLERRGNRFLTGVAAFYDAQRLPKFLRVQSFGKAGHFFGASRDDNIGNQFAGRNFPQAMDENRRAIQLQKLFGSLRAHARTESCGIVSSAPRPSTRERPPPHGGPRAPRARIMVGRSLSGAAPSEPVQNVTPFAGWSTIRVRRSSSTQAEVRSTILSIAGR